MAPCKFPLTLCRLGDFQAAVAALRPMAGAFAEDIAQSIGVLHEIAQALHANRVRRGGMDFESEEAKVRLNDEGVPVSVAIRRKTDATALVEEAMIAANEAVARYLRDAGIPSISRVHEPPSPGRFGRTRANSSGIWLRQACIACEFQGRRSVRHPAGALVRAWAQRGIPRVVACGARNEARGVR